MDIKSSRSAIAMITFRNSQILLIALGVIVDWFTKNILFFSITIRDYLILWDIQRRSSLFRRWCNDDCASRQYPVGDISDELSCSFVRFSLGFHRLNASLNWT